MAEAGRVPVGVESEAKVLRRIPLPQTAQRIVAGARPPQVMPRALVEDFGDPPDVVWASAAKDRRPGYRAPGISVDSGWRPE
jgi:hypothetical protein